MSIVDIFKCISSIGPIARALFARGLGLEPEKVLIQTEFAEPHRVYVTAEDREQAQAKALSIAIKELIKRKLMSSGEFFASSSSHSAVT